MSIRAVPNKCFARRSGPIYAFGRYERSPDIPRKLWHFIDLSPALGNQMMWSDHLALVTICLAAFLRLLTQA